MGAAVCECLPLTELLHLSSPQTFCDASSEREDKQGAEDDVLIAPALGEQLLHVLKKVLLQQVPITLLVLHVCQLETVPLALQFQTPYLRHRYHGSEQLLEQVLVQVRRSIRMNDTLLIHEHSGAALLFPGMDQRVAFRVVERVYDNLSLLQAETMIPPLMLETIIGLGTGSISPAETLEDLLKRTGKSLHRILLRPALMTQISTVAPRQTPIMQGQEVPFLKLPEKLPIRLTRLLPYDLALELQCAPVGHDQQCLTVAMIEPENESSVTRLQEATGMAIFPVACDEQALAFLLQQRW